MDFDQWLKLAGVLVGLSGATATMFLARRSATNREAMAYRRADESLKLAKAIEDTNFSDDDEKSQAKGLRRKLVDGALKSAHLYELSTRPVFTSYWQSNLFLVFGLAWCVFVAVSPMGPGPEASGWWYAPYGVLVVVVICIASRMYKRVAEFRSNVKGLQELGNSFASTAATSPAGEVLSAASNPTMATSEGSGPVVAVPAASGPSAPAAAVPEN